MIPKLLIFIILILVLIGIIFGVKLLIDKIVNLPSENCKASASSNGGFSCACSEGTCADRMNEFSNKS
jgi:hypothetical protein